jgi:hypothetical protein
MTYLHLALGEEVLQLFEYAPVATGGGVDVVVREEPPEEEEQKTGAAESDDNDANPSKDADTANHEDAQKTETATETKTKTEPMPIRNNNYPICWFEDESTGEPLQWHRFIGVIFDAMKGKAMLQHSSRIGFSNESTAPNVLPWRIRVHFTAYPTTLLPLDISDTAPPKVDTTEHKDSCREIDKNTNQITSTIGRIFRNSFKQALFMQYSSTKVAMSITKSSHEKMWDAILSTNYTLYHEVNMNLQMGLTSSLGEPSTDKDADSNVPELIPVRVMLNGDSPMQKPCRAFRDAEVTQESTHNEQVVNDSADDQERLESLVKHLSTCNIRHQTTLGDILIYWLPQHFERGTDGRIVAKPYVSHCIQGIQPNLKCSMLDLWKSLCHPDHFLYIVVVTKT